MPTEITQDLMLKRHGHMIGRIVAIEARWFHHANPDDGDFSRTRYQILDREGVCYGDEFVSLAEFHSWSMISAAFVPDYMDQGNPDGQMLTLLKQRRDREKFNVRHLRGQLQGEIADVRAGEQMNVALYEKTWAEYRRRFSAYLKAARAVDDQIAADRGALAQAQIMGAVVDSIFQGLSK